MEQKNLIGRVVLIAMVVGCGVWAYLGKGLRLGQDLKGGTTLRFSLDIERARREGKLAPGDSDTEVVEQTLRVIGERIDRFGVAELNLIAVGEDKFELSLPSERDPDSMVKLVTALGNLAFRIEVLPDAEYRHDDKSGDRTRRNVWAGAGEKYPATPEGFREYKKAEAEAWKKARDQAVAYVPMDPRYRLAKKKDTAGTVPEDFVLLEEPQEARYRFGGELLSNIKPDHDDTGLPNVIYEVKAAYQHVFAVWTGENIQMPMAIVLNDEYDSAPYIQSELSTNVQITLGGSLLVDGRRTLEERAKQLATVLQTGSLKVQPRLESKSSVGPTLAGMAVDRGLLATLVAFVLVLLFMIAFYLGSGMIANVALLMNLVLLVGAMAFLDATLTLPGIAGIVLTLGMAVDANILIFERIREEQAAGRTLVRAVAEGYDRAFTTIVDSNVTTFFTAVFLYAFGTGSIKGFAVSLTLGLLASMFTAIYVTRTWFEWRIRKGRTAPIRMTGRGVPPKIRWLSLRGRLIPVSLLLVGASIGLFAVSDAQTVYDIDFTGGMKLQARFHAPTTVDAVKEALASKPAHVRITKEAATGETGAMLEGAGGPYPDAEVVTGGTGGDWVECARSRAGAAARAGDVSLSESERLEALQAFVEATFQDRLVPPWVREGPVTYASTGDADPMKAFDGRLRIRLALEDPKGAVTPERLEAAIREVMPYSYDAPGGRRTRESSSLVRREVKAVPVAGAAGARDRTFDVWIKSDHATALTPVENVPDRLKQDLFEFLSAPVFRDALVARGAPEDAAKAVSLTAPFPLKDLIGAGVARRLRDDALVALLLSLVAIVGYVAFRFRSYSMGFSAILCLVHDVAVALGAVCLADHLGLVDAKINLGLVAAFLTIVGFSVNDTVVTFDRIRELRGRSPRISAKMIDDAVNQTLSRTWRTSATALMTVVVLFVLNVGQRSMLEGLSYTLMIGMVAGVYSTVAIAAPLLLFLPWFWERIKKWRPRTSVATWPAKGKGGQWLLVGAVVAFLVLWFGAGLDGWLAAFYGLLLLPAVVTAGAWLAWTLAFSIGAFVLGYFSLFRWTFTHVPEIDVETDGGGGAAAAIAAAGAGSGEAAGSGPGREPPRSSAYRPKGPEAP